MAKVNCIYCNKESEFTFKFQADHGVLEHATIILNCASCGDQFAVEIGFKHKGECQVTNAAKPDYVG